MRTSLTTILAALLVVTACSAGSGDGPSPGPSGTALPSAPASASPAVPVDSAEAAAKAVLAQQPYFANIEPKDPDLIGQSAWYEVTEVDGGWQVVVEIGWGDCPAGCIDKHRWTWAVARTGEVALLNETGDPVPPEVIEGLGRPSDY